METSVPMLTPMNGVSLSFDRFAAAAKKWRNYLWAFDDKSGEEEGGEVEIWRAVLPANKGEKERERRRKWKMESMGVIPMGFSFSSGVGLCFY